jgi:hypothetical protein
MASGDSTGSQLKHGIPLCPMDMDWGRVQPQGLLP